MGNVYLNGICESNMLVILRDRGVFETLISEDPDGDILISAMSTGLVETEGTLSLGTPFGGICFESFWGLGSLLLGHGWAVGDHVEDGLMRLIEQFKRKPRIRAILTAYLDQVQVIENTFADMLKLTSLDDCEGTNLDTLGEIIGQERGGLDDANYRDALAIRAMLNRCEGSPEQLIEILSLLAHGRVWLREYYPASMLLWPMVALPASSAATTAARWLAYLKQGKIGGVSLRLFYGTISIDKVKMFDTAGQGFDSGVWGTVI